MAYAVGHISGGHFNCAVTVAGAELSYQQAIAIAKRQSAKMFELRAATSLARLWRDQAKREEARGLLAPVYRWFTEGFGRRPRQWR
jgi:predicted ATPase